MTEKKRFLVKYLEYEAYYIDTKQEYVDEAELRFELDGYKTMSDEQVVSLLNENEQLKSTLIEKDKEISSLKDARYSYKQDWKYASTNLELSTQKIELLEDNIKGLIEEREELKKENEQLKKDVDYWKQVASQYSNELNVFEHCKKYKTECKDIYWSSD